MENKVMIFQHYKIKIWRGRFSFQERYFVLWVFFFVCHLELSKRSEKWKCDKWKITNIKNRNLKSLSKYFYPYSDCSQFYDSFGHKNNSQKRNDYADVLRRPTIHRKTKDFYFIYYLLALNFFSISSIFLCCIALNDSSLNESIFHTLVIDLPS